MERIVVKKTVSLLFLILSYLLGAYAQECNLKLQTARDYKSKGDYKNAVVWYKKVLNDCGDHDGKVKAELQECQRKSRPQRSSEQYVPVEQPGLRLNDTQIFFEAEGGNDAHIYVTCEGQWVVNVTKGKDWFDVGKNGNLLVVDCLPNTKSEQRDGVLYIIAGEGTIVAKVTVQQEEGDYSTAYTSPTVPESLKGGIVFENGGTTPIFDYKREDMAIMVEILKKEIRMGLQVEIPWCRNLYDMKLLEQRYESIADHFVSMGIRKDRISRYIYKNNDDRADACDEAYLRVVTMSDKNTSEKDKPFLPDLTDVLSKSKITFDKDKDIPIIDDNNDNINRTVEIMKTNPTFSLQIEGYSDNKGSEEHQRDLAQRRANKVMQLFIDKGVPANQISTVTYTSNDLHFKQNIPDGDEFRCAVFRILIN